MSLTTVRYFLERLAFYLLVFFSDLVLSEVRIQDFHALLCQDLLGPRHLAFGPDGSTHPQAGLHDQSLDRSQGKHIFIQWNESQDVSDRYTADLVLNHGAGSFDRDELLAM